MILRTSRVPFPELRGGSFCTCRGHIRSARWRNEDRSFSETSSDGWRVGHCVPRLEYAGTLPSARRLGVRQPEDEREATLLAGNTTEVLCTARREATWHHEANRLAFFPENVCN